MELSQFEKEIRFEIIEMIELAVRQHKYTRELYNIKIFYDMNSITRERIEDIVNDLPSKKLHSSDFISMANNTFKIQVYNSSMNNKGHKADALLYICRGEDKGDYFNNIYRYVVSFSRLGGYIKKIS